ncbi:MAG: 2-amino-4-hydroxy-6-hydroxymethyldihydropteridine diphosphokinase [Rhodanobacteraceae bacterium]
MSAHAVDAVAYVALGSNLDDPAWQVRRALAALDGKLPGVRLLRHSHLYRSAPWGVLEQPDFVNAVAELATSLSPRRLLDALLRIEREQGRERIGERWGPRLIDLDLLLHGNLTCNEPGLHLPHPRLAERAFVLVPLAELASLRRVPGSATVAELLAAVDTSKCTALVEAD